MKNKVKNIIVLAIVILVISTITVTAALVTSANNITFSSDKTDKTDVKEALDELYTKTTNGTQCPTGYECIKIEPLSIVEIGDYIKMIPTSTSYTPLSSDTGCMNDSNCTQNTLNPSELNLWRVIRKNNDRTIEVVSEYVSSTAIYFRGKAGYLNLVGGLNTIAAQYTNSKYVSKTRHIGYSNQTETITNATALSKTTAPWTKNTSVFNQWTGCSSSSNMCGANESSGAGDIGYETDYNLVKTALGTMIGKTPSGIASRYWLASRYYGYYTTDWSFRGRYVKENNVFDNLNLYRYQSGFSSDSQAFAIRPILTLKADAKIVSGDGKSAETAYEFK